MIDSDIKERPSVRNSKWVKRLPAIFFLGAISYLFPRNQVYAAPKTVRLDTLHLQRLDGTELDAEDLKGKAVVLNFWAPWCPPCRLEMPWLQKLQTTHPGLKVVGVEDNADEYGNAIDFAEHAGISFCSFVTTSLSTMNSESFLGCRQRYTYPLAGASCTPLPVLSLKQ